MKYVTTFCFVTLITVISGCSKPEPPRTKALPPTKKATVKKYIQNINTVSSETFLVDTQSPAMANVRVTDADTGLPITHAAVRARWASGDYPEMCFGIHIDDGVYQVPTNAIKGAFYIGAHADGYLPNDKENPRFPVELSMKEGETIEVSGTIHHANGNPVTNGIINLLLRDIAQQNKHWQRLSPCSVMPDSNGTFILPHIPAGMDEIYVKYDLPDDTIVEFKDQAFSTAEGDVHLTLQLPPVLAIKGQVLFSSGSAVSGAWIWTERVSKEAPDAWNKKLAEKDEAVSGVTTNSDTEGHFELTLLKIMDRYIIKACHPLYAVAYAGPYSDSVPPPDPLELIIQEEGARLYGRLIDTNGNPVTNCLVEYSIFKRTAPNSRTGKSNKLLLDIAEDGNYISGIIPPGSHKLAFTTRGHYPQSKNVIIQENLAEQCNVEFLPYFVVTGIVCDEETQEPIPNVVLVNKSWRGRDKQKFSKSTDQNGKFWMLDSSFRIEFQHPEYTPIIYTFSQIMNLKNISVEDLISKLSPKIYLSKSGDIRVFGQKSDGTPLDGYKVRSAIDRPNKLENTLARFSSSQRATFIDGEALLTNIYVMLSPVYVIVYSDNYNESLTKSDLIEVIAGKEVSATVTLPPTGSLVLNFLNPFDTDSLKIVGKRMMKDKYQTRYDFVFDRYHMIREGNRFILNNMLTNMYQISIKDKEVFSLKTNVLITANASTEIIIDNNTNAVNVIRGSVTTRSGGIIECCVHLNEPETGKQIKYEWLHDNRKFSFYGLSQGNLYDLTIEFHETSMTNISFKNISPTGPPIDIKLPDFYRITGNVIDSDGNPLKAKIGIKSLKDYGPGEFTLYYVFSGKHSVCISAKDYDPVEREVTVYDSNVDLGDIMLKPTKDQSQ